MDINNIWASLPRPNEGRISRKQVRGMVRCSLRDKLSLASVNDINDQLPVPEKVVPDVLREIGKIMEREIPKRRKPQRSWKVSTLVGYIYHTQGTFKKTPTPAQ